MNVPQAGVPIFSSKDRSSGWGWGLELGSSRRTAVYYVGTGFLSLYFLPDLFTLQSPLADWQEGSCKLHAFFSPRTGTAQHVLFKLCFF